MSKIAVGIVVFILLGIAVYFVTTRGKNAVTNPVPSPVASANSIDEEVRNELLQGGSSYADPNGVYVFLYPNEYTLDTQNDGKQSRIYKRGPTQKGQTEMYDGVIMSFESLSLGGKNLENWTDEYIENLTTDGTIELIESKEKIEINNFPGYTFRIRGLGEHQYYVVQKDETSDLGTIIATSVSDPTNAGFQTEVNAVLSTLDLLK